MCMCVRRFLCRLRQLAYRLEQMVLFTSWIPSTSNFNRFLLLLPRFLSNEGEEALLQLRKILQERNKAKQKEKEGKKKESEENEKDVKDKPSKRKLRKLIINDDDDDDDEEEEEEENVQNLHNGTTPMDISTSSTPQTHVRILK